MDDQFKVRGKPATPPVRRRIYGVPDSEAGVDSIEKLYTDQITQKAIRSKKPRVKTVKFKLTKMTKQKMVNKLPFVLAAAIICSTGFVIVRRTQTVGKPTQVTVDDETKKTIDVLTTGVLGASASNDSQIGGLPKESPKFSILIPLGKSQNQLTIVRNSPDQSDPTYVFADTVEDADIQVSQQKIPKQLESNQGVELQKLAEGFNAKNIIQIDNLLVYHGISTKSKRQTLIFIKKDLLVIINSSKGLDDNVWSGYIAGLN